MTEISPTTNPEPLSPEEAQAKAALSSVQALRVDPKCWQRLRRKARRLVIGSRRLIKMLVLNGLHSGCDYSDCY